MFWIPFLGALALAGGTLIEKTILKKKGLEIKFYQTASFFAISLFSAILLLFFWKLSPQALETKNLVILMLVIAFSMIANLLAFYSLKWEKVTNLEPVRILEPLFVILLALLFSFIIDSTLYERNARVLIPALISALALFFSHVRRHHFSMNKYVIAGILGSFFFALELVISRMILDFYSPVTFYFFRSIGIFILSLAIFRPKIKNIDRKTYSLIFSAALIWVVYRIIIYYGYIHYGIIFTTLIIMLAPVLIYLLAWKLLKEKPTWKNILASIIIVACVIYVTLM